MEDVERRAVETTGVSLAELMERAGAAVAKTARRMAGSGSVVVVSGKGNNGGDGIVAARLLAEADVRTTLFLLTDTASLTSESSAAMKRLRESETGIDPIVLSSEDDLPRLREYLTKASLVVDCVFGFNLRGAAGGLAADVIGEINVAARPVLSVDMPSGVEADSGRAAGEAIRASRTVTFSAPKVGLLAAPGAGLAGRVQVADIGIPSELLEDAGSIEAPDAATVAAMLPSRPFDAHKKSVGRVLVVAGSVGMTGAACLTAQGALRSGAGTVSLAAPQSLNDIFEVKLTEVMTIPMPETMSRSLLAGAADSILELCANFDSVVIGPGLSLDESTVQMVRSLVEKISLPVVLDADGLNAIVNKTAIIEERRAPTIVTPHSGELARLMKVTSEEIDADRIGCARRSAGEWDVVTVLKGAGTVVSDGTRVSVNSTGNPGLASAGTGDVLAGMIGSVVAQGAAGFEAAVVSAYIHGLAGDLAAHKLTERCVTATDVISFLPTAFRRVAKATRRGTGGDLR